MSTVRIHGIVNSTNALGPGNRAVVWFQGCERRCKGCMSPSSRPVNGGTEWDVARLVNYFSAIRDIEGITISGGEPFLQIEALYEFLAGIHGKTDFGIIIYTGYTMEQLRQMQNPQVDEIISSMADIIIDGEYIDELNDGSSLRGSSNQTVNYITDRYEKDKGLYDSGKRNVQILIEGNDALLIGVPDRNTLNVWKQTTEKMKERAQDP